MKKFILFLFTVVIIDPYEGLDYDKINLYELNSDQSNQFCSDYYENDCYKRVGQEQDSEQENELLFSKYEFDD